MRLLKIGCTVLAATLLACTVQAQTEKGKWELSLLGSYSAGWATVDTGSEDDFSTDTLQVYLGSVGVGIFLTDALELKGNTSIIGARGGDLSMYVVPLTLELDYHFNTKSKTVPYVGAGAGVWLVGAGLNETSGALGGALGEAHVGLKQFVSPNVAIDFRLGYQYIPLSIVTLNSVNASVGLSFQF